MRLLLVPSIAFVMRRLAPPSVPDGGVSCQPQEPAGVSLADIVLDFDIAHGGPKSADNCHYPSTATASPTSRLLARPPKRLGLSPATLLRPCSPSALSVSGLLQS